MTHAAISTPDFLKYVENYCPMKRIGREGKLYEATIYFASDSSSCVTG